MLNITMRELHRCNNDVTNIDSLNLNNNSKKLITTNSVCVNFYMFLKTFINNGEKDKNRIYAILNDTCFKKIKDNKLEPYLKTPESIIMIASAIKNGSLDINNVLNDFDTITQNIKSYYIFNTYVRA